MFCFLIQDAMGAWRDGSAVRTLVTLADKAPIHIREKKKSSGRASVVEGGCGIRGLLHPPPLDHVPLWG